MSVIERDASVGAPRCSGAGQIVVTDDSARGGPEGRRVLYVLLGVMLGTAIAVYLVARYAGFF